MKYPTLGHLFHAILSLPQRDAADILNRPIKYYTNPLPESLTPAAGIGISLEPDGSVAVDFDSEKNVVWISQRRGDTFDLAFMKAPEFIPDSAQLVEER